MSRPVDAGYLVLIAIGLLAPYVISVLYLAPKCVGLYTEIHAFRRLDEDAMLEVREDLEVAKWLAGWLADWLTDWLAGWLIDWLAGWLAGWLAD